MPTIKVLKYGTEDYLHYITLREAIMRTPLNLSFSIEELSKETSNIHIGAYEGSALIGTVMLVPQTSARVKLRQLAVDDEWQKRGIGKQLVQFAEAEAKRLGYKEMTMTARLTAADFYEKLGYRTEGEPFEEITIMQVTMSKKL